MKTKLLLLMSFLLCISWQAEAQISEGGTPYAFTLQNKGFLNAKIPVVAMPLVDVESYKREDEATKDELKPYRFGVEIPVEIGFKRGVWQTLGNGDRVWNVSIVSPNALSINLIFKKYRLPEGAKLFIYNKKQEVLGAFTNKNNKDNGIFATDLIQGDFITFEYYEPKEVIGKGQIELSTVIHGYRAPYGFGDTNARPCHNNVNCAVGAPWTCEIDASMLIVLAGSSCSGSLINNTNQDQTPYVLTANHCYTFDPNPGSWVFRFNWQSATCTTPGSSPSFQSVSGAAFRARRSTTDFCLVEITSSIPTSYGITFAGWDNTGTVPLSVAGIHHPAGDIKKISFDSNAVSNGTNRWLIDQWDDGLVEPGSSGSPLFNQNHQIIGQLWNGDLNLGCTSSGGSFVDNNNYGKFSESWTGGGTNSTRLSNWLDPGNTGVEVLKSMGCDTGYDLAGFDSSRDGGEEPNNSGQGIWQSPDIWNRRTNSGLNLTHEDPGYLGSNSNVMRFRVHNVSFTTSSVSYAKLYWTLGSTGEAWPESWDGTTLINGNPAGAELTVPYTGFNATNTYVAGQGFRIPALAPGQEYIIDAKWQPDDPAIFGLNNGAMICFLGRIVDPNDPMANENPGPGAPIGPNVSNNNNIVTRNASLVNLGGNYLNGFGGIVVGNHTFEHALFDVNFTLLDDDQIAVPFREVGEIRFQLSQELWNLWLENGRQAEGIEIINEEEREVVLTQPSRAQLLNLRMPPGVYYPLSVEFRMNQGFRQSVNYHFAFSQNYSENREEAYGSECHYFVELNGRGNEDRGEPFRRQTTVDDITLIPNPSRGQFTVQIQEVAVQRGTIQVLDVNTGQLLYEKSFKHQDKVPVDLGNLRPNIYILKLITDKKVTTKRIIVN
ncbi:trypsin-like peptidase domain-containing protein [Kordia jejudonensis]|uniref:trypsin-like peptidase domain-containing protein n=1 Tax=Kordia jejudonensis TaxID=1348245 RepID=UPI00069B09CB|nr:trypsin-like peptidase domain-containing protein [Kordia jejudonensis]